MTQPAARPIPGPPPSAENGNLDDIAAAGGLHNFQLRLHEEYGDVARFRLSGTDIVSVADPVLLELTARVNERPDKLFEFLAPLFEAGNLQTIQAAEHVPWRRLVLSPLGSHKAHAASFPAFTRLTLDLADRWARQAGPVELQRDLSELSLRMICHYVVGGEIESTSRVVSAFEDVLSEYLGRLYQVPSPIPADERQQQADEALAFLRATVDKVLAAHQTTGEAAGTDLISALAAGGIEPARIRDTVLAMLLAAHHTSGVAASWTLHLLAQHPEVTARVRQELDDTLGDRAAPSYEELRRLNHLEMTLKESMRLYPPGPYAAREVTTDLTLGEYVIPAGTTLFYPIWAVHKNPRYWPDPERFDPQRFASTAGRPKYAFIPFGFGPRSCEGAALAMVEVELVLAVLLKRFDFQPVPGHPVTPIERFVLWAADDIKMTLTPRA